MKPMTVLFSFFAALAFIASPASAQSFTGCYAHHPQYIDSKIEVSYAPGCVVTTNPNSTPSPALRVQPAT